MRGQHEADFVVANVDVGVMIRRLRNYGDLIDECNCVNEVFECERLGYRVAVLCPSTELFQTHGVSLPQPV